MENIFKQNLLRLKAPNPPKTFGEALMGDVSWIKSKPAPAKIPEVIQKEAFSEKAQVIESLERFAQEKSEAQGSPVIKIEGGEMSIRPEPGWSGIIEAESMEELLGSLSLEESVLEIALHNKVPGKVKAMFVTENFRSYEEIAPELKEGFINELIVGFPLKTAELFERMIVAMKLTPEEVVLYPVEGLDDLSEEVMTIAAYLKPEVIITLGAQATQKILKGNDRLSVVHGQFFKRSIEDVGTYQVVPLFHPSIIETNQNMKKTAWADMQKIMKFLKKLP